MQGSMTIDYGIDALVKISNKFFEFWKSQENMNSNKDALLFSSTQYTHTLNGTSDGDWILGDGWWVLVGDWCR